MDITFQSVVLAGVYDVKNLKLKLREDEESKYNSPWNIAEDFNMDLSFCPKDIEGMLAEYEADYAVGMDISLVFPKKLYDYSDIRDMLCNILFRGVRYSFEINNPSINIGVMFGFIKEKDNAVVIANRFFETKMYNLFLLESEVEGKKRDIF